MDVARCLHMQSLSMSVNWGAEMGKFGVTVTWSAECCVEPVWPDLVGTSVKLKVTPGEEISRLMP